MTQVSVTDFIGLGFTSRRLQVYTHVHTHVQERLVEMDCNKFFDFVKSNSLNIEICF
jgi:hypothetical protein